MQPQWRLYWLPARFALHACIPLAHIMLVDLNGGLTLPTPAEPRGQTPDMATDGWCDLAVTPVTCSTCLIA